MARKGEEERVGRQFQIFKPIARALKLDTVDSEDNYGESLSQQDIVNLILAKHYRLNFGDMLHGTKNGLSKIEGSAEETEEWNNPLGEAPAEKEEKKVLVLTEEFISAIMDNLRRGRGWEDIQSGMPQLNTRCFTEQVMREAEARGITFIP